MANQEVEAPALSIVMAVNNEAESIEFVLQELAGFLKNSELLGVYEVIVVDDGSDDGTSEIVRASLSSSFEGNGEIVRFHRNFGQTHALQAGFQRSKGRVVVAMDGDGQNDPRDISRLVNLILNQEVDCVSGWRRNRTGDGGLRNFFSRVANRLLARASGVRIHDSGCTLKAYKGEVIRQVPLYGDLHRLIPFQISLLGGSVVETEVNHRSRFGGRSKYTLARTFRVLQDIVVAFFLKRFIFRPMHLLGSLGMSLIFLGLIGGTVALVLKIQGMRDFVETPLLLLSLILIIGGLNILGTGLIAEMLNRHFTATGLPVYPLSQANRLPPRK